MRVKTVTLDQWNEIGGVQQKENGTENGPLWYTTENKCREDVKEPVRTYWYPPTRYD